jgi:hypothetical protein
LIEKKNEKNEMHICCETHKVAKRPRIRIGCYTMQYNSLVSNINSSIHKLSQMRIYKYKIMVEWDRIYEIWKDSNKKN